MREHRTAAGISLRDMADERVKVPRSTISDAETGHGQPSKDLLEGYERELNLEAGSLLQYLDPTASLFAALRRLMQYDNRAEDKLGQISIPAFDRSYAVEGLQAVIEVATALLLHTSQAGPKQEEKGDEIIMTSFGGHDFTEGHELRAAWLQALCLVLEKNFQVVGIWGPSTDAGQRILLVCELLKLLHPDWQYHPCFLDRPYSTNFMSRDFIISPYGMLELLPLHQTHIIDSASFFPPTSDHYQLLRRYATLMRENAKPLLEKFPSAHRAHLAFSEAILAAELRDGDECLLINDFSAKMRPPEVEFARVERICAAYPELPAAEVAQLKRIAEITRSRRARFTERLKQRRVRHIFDKRVIAKEVEDARSYVDGWVRHYPKDNAAAPTRDEIHQFVRQLIDDLTLRDNYELALIELPNPNPSSQIFWEVIGDHSAFFLAQRADSSAGESSTIVAPSHIDLASYEPTVVRSIKEYFADTWSRIPRECKDRKSVIAQLRSFIS